MDNRKFMENLKDIFIGLKNNHPKFKIEESVKGMFPVLNILFHNEEVTPKDLELKLCVSSARIARVLNQLEEKGLVIRTQSENDKRKTIVILTEKGKNIAINHKNEFEYFTDLILTDISDEEKEEFIRLVRKMANNINGGKNNA